MQAHNSYFPHEVLVVGLPGYLGDRPMAKNPVSLVSLRPPMWRPDYVLILLIAQDRNLRLQNLEPGKWVSPIILFLIKYTPTWSYGILYKFEKATPSSSSKKLY